ncbi:hypothetical protein RIF29_39127 [Crotalaria pallida]|uniref:Uncharacterized protein n=1 Tax=Crotalaria pallida TaxID=3830 RepID=A0AAN9HQE0_CROPI
MTQIYPFKMATNRLEKPWTKSEVVVTDLRTFCRVGVERSQIQAGGNCSQSLSSDIGRFYRLRVPVLMIPESSEWWHQSVICGSSHIRHFLSFKNPNTHKKP